MSIYQRLRNNIPSSWHELSAFGNGFRQGFAKEKSHRSKKRMLGEFWVDGLDKLLGPTLVAAIVVGCIVNAPTGLAMQGFFGFLNLSRSIPSYIMAAPCFITALHFSDPFIGRLLVASAFGIFLNEVIQDLRTTSTVACKIYQGLIDGKAELERFRTNMQKERDIMAPVVTTLFGTAQQQSPLSRLPQPVIKDVVMPLLAASSRYGNENLAENFFASKYAKRAAQQQAAANRNR